MNTKIFRKTLIATSVGLALASGSAFAAVGDPTNEIAVDFDGSAAANGTVQVGSLDWAVGSSLSDQAIVTAVGDDAQLYTHATLAGYGNSSGNPTGLVGLNSTFEWTFIFGGAEKVTSSTSSTSCIGTCDGGGDDVYAVDSSATFGNADAQSNFFFEVYYDDFTSGVQSNILPGTGFNDGQLILSASSLDNISGNFDSTIMTFTDLNNNGFFDPGEMITDPDDANFAFALLDSFGADNWSVAGGDTFYSVNGEGGTSLEATVDPATLDTSFFVEGLIAMITDLVFSTQNVAPFTTTNPSLSFNGSAGGASTLSLAGGDIVLAGIGNDNLVNGISGLAATGQATGKDILFQTDANQAFRSVRRVPEPASIALLGLGLLGMFGLNRQTRRREESMQA